MDPTHPDETFDPGSLRLHGQLIQPLAENTHMPCMCEILLRIEEEDGDLVLPAQFIAAAEHHHLMPRIDRWVVHRAFRVVRRLTESTSSMVYTINLSGQSIGEHAFLGEIISEIAAARIDPRRICFEITETAAIVNLSVALHFINELKGLGCRFALDDFGTGFSSFAYLKNLRVDYLKIDGQFVRDVSNDPLHHALVESINQIGHLMGILTIAECVEDTATMEVLKQLNVDYAQGYCIARPEPLDAGLLEVATPAA
jgi:EAL domain-containing protein (putative c-di-GMP-specific phosphodiesterase class I)